jgi:hypothetical protein
MVTIGTATGLEQHVVGAQHGVPQCECMHSRMRQNGRRQLWSQQQQPADSRVTAKPIVAINRRKRMEGIPLCWVGAWGRASRPCDDYLHKLLPL